MSGTAVACVSRSAICLRARYAMSGTDTACTTRTSTSTSTSSPARTGPCLTLPWRSAQPMSGAHMHYDHSCAMRPRVCYAMCGTGIGYRAAVLCDVWY
eukprot:178411-Rhodomonas_salina.3